MGYIPQQAPIPQATPVTNRVAPPPKPQTEDEAALAALLSLEKALAVKFARRPRTDEEKAQFKTYQGIKARALRPGTPAEGEVALSLAIQRLVKMVWN